MASIRDLVTLLNSYRRELEAAYKRLDKANNPYEVQAAVDTVRILEAAIQATQEQIENIEVK